MKIVYVAGPITPKGNRTDTANHAIEYLSNIRDLIAAAITLIKKGYAPYCPGIDFAYFLHLRPGETISETEIKDISMAFLEASSCVFFLPRWETSSGSRAEFARAIKKGLPIYYTMDEVPDAGL